MSWSYQAALVLPGRSQKNIQFEATERREREAAADSGAARTSPGISQSAYKQELLIVENENEKYEATMG